jgi:hypothetical protein
MEDTDLAEGNLLSDKMKINLHMFGALMLNGVGGEVHNTDVVTVDKGAPRRWGLELVELLSQPSTPAMPLAMTQYSASALEWETTVCRLADQETKLPPRNTT